MKLPKQRRAPEDMERLMLAYVAGDTRAPCLEVLRREVAKYLNAPPEPIERPVPPWT
jgi:hypothetical protein